jgi:hypothetical protein
MSNPFSRRRRDPLEQVLDAVEELRSEAARRAADIRDAAGGAADLLGEAAPEARRHRVPVLLGVAAAAVGTAIALRSRRRRVPEPERPREPVAATEERAAAEERER